MATEIASAYVTLTTKMPGVKKDIETSLGGADGVSEAAGGRAGKKFGAALAIGIAAAAAAVTASVIGLYKAGAVFDQVSDTIRVGTGAQGDALEGLIDVSNRVAASIPANFEAVGSTVADLNTRLGLSGDILQTVASQYLEAGRMLGETVDVRSSTAAFNAFGVAQADISDSLDTMFRVSQATGIGMNQLSSTIVTAAPLVQNLGFGFGETAALVGTLDKAGLDANRMLMTLGPGLVNMAKDGEQPADVFPRIIDQLNGLIESGDTASAIQLAGGIFGTRGAAQFVAALQSGKVNLDDLVGGVGATEDTILGLSAETASAGQSWKVFKNNALLAIKPVSDAVFGLAGDGMGKLAAIAQEIGPQIAENFAGLLETFGPLIGQVVELWSELSPVSILFQAIQPVLPVLGDALTQLAEPLGLIAELFGGLVAQVLPLLMPILVQVIGIMAQLLAAVVPIVASLLDGLMPVFEALIPVVLAIIEAVLPLVSVLLDALMPIIEALLPVLGPDGIGGLLVALGPIFEMLLPPIAAVVQMLADILVPIIKMVTDVLTGLIDFLVGVFTGDWEKAWGGISKIFVGIWNGWVGIAEGVINGIIDLINGMIGSVNVVVTAVGLPEMGKLGHVNFGAAQLAEGGVVSKRPGGILAQIGEGRYDEAVMPLGGPQLDKIKEALGGGDSGTGVRDVYLQNPDPYVLLDMFSQRFGQKVRLV